MFSGREGGKRDMRFSGRTSRENNEGKTDGQTDRQREVGFCFPDWSLPPFFSSNN